MAIESICASCGQRLSVADEHRGKQGRCPSCGTIYWIGSDGVGSQGSVGSPTGNNGTPSWAPASLPSTPTAPLSGSDSQTNQSLYTRTPDGSVFGPVDRAGLSRWIQEGRINDTCYVREGVSGSWQSVPEFMRKGASAPPPFASPVSHASPLATTNPYANPFSDASPTTVNPADFSSPYSGYQSDRSGIVLTMGILSWVLSCMSVGWILAIIGVVLAQQDFAMMRAGTMRPESRSLTHIGFWLCVVHLILIGIATLSIVGLMIIGILTEA